MNTYNIGTNLDREIELQPKMGQSHNSQDNRKIFKSN